MAVRLFFGDQHHIGKFRPQSGRDQGIRRLIGLGHRRGVTLRLYLKIRAVVDIHDPVARFQRQTADDGNKAGEIH